MKVFSVSLILLFTSVSVFSQDLAERDSLLQLLATAKDDSTRIELLISTGQQFEMNDPNAAKSFYADALTLSKEIGNSRLLVKSIFNYTFILNFEGKFDSSLALNLQSVNIAKKLQDSTQVAKALFNSGTSYNLMGDYENAVSYYLEGRQYFINLGNDAILPQANDIIQLLYHNMRQHEKGIYYGRMSVSGLRKMNAPALLTGALVNLGVNYVAAGKTDSGRICFNEALQLAEKYDNLMAEISLHLNLGDLDLRAASYHQMKEHFEQSLQLSKQLKSSENLLLAYKGLSFYQMSQNNFELARQYADSALALSFANNLRRERADLYSHFSTLFYIDHNFKEGQKYGIAATLLDDSLLNETITRSTRELETRFEVQQKESKIQQLNAERKIQQLNLRQQRTWNYLLLASAAFLLIVLGLFYRNYRQKQSLQQQRINELETEKQLMATEAVLKGEEQERSRLAKDLHDGLGGMLSGIKYSLNTMKKNLIMTPENGDAFERSIDMLDSAIKEMRRVAHNMMPEALLKFGLDEALEDFCREIDETGAISLKYQSLGLTNQEFEQTVSITVYRIVQELVNNAIKHAAASNVLVQLSKTDDLLTLTVEDDGKGFDVSTIKEAKGIGWTNIQHRIEFLKGKLDVNSKPGDGTSVLIELPLS